MARRPLTDAPEVEVASRSALRAWLERHHGRTSGLWLVTYKGADPDRYLPCDAIVEEGLALGWVDGLPRAKDGGIWSVLDPVEGFRRPRRGARRAAARPRLRGQTARARPARASDNITQPLAMHR
jgi:hypothetical protein